MSEPLFQLTDVSKGYLRGRERVEIFKALDLTIAVGDFIAVQGPSGSGKSTLLNLLGAIDRADAGDIRFRGAPIGRLSEAKLADYRARHIGFVFQFYNLMPNLNALKNVALPLLLAEMTPGERLKRARTALDLVGLADRAMHKPRELSGGQQQRVAIARAIIADPEALLCDEPTGDLDRAAAEDVLAILQTLNRELGKTIVMVTHDPLAARHARRELHLDKGQFVEREMIR